MVDSQSYTVEFHSESVFEFIEGEGESKVEAAVSVFEEREELLVEDAVTGHEEGYVRVYKMQEPDDVDEFAFSELREKV